MLATVTAVAREVGILVGRVAILHCLQLLWMRHDTVPALQPSLQQRANVLARVWIMK